MWSEYDGRAEFLAARRSLDQHERSCETLPFELQGIDAHLGRQSGGFEVHLVPGAGLCSPVEEHRDLLAEHVDDTDYRAALSRHREGDGGRRVEGVRVARQQCQ